MGEGPAVGLAKTLEEANFKLMRLKTGELFLSCSCLSYLVVLSQVETVRAKLIKLVDPS